MARTYKRYPPFYFRSPRGHRQARRAGLRKSKTPPDAWEDVPFDRQVWLPYKVAKGLAKKGISYQDIVRHVQLKFKMPLDDAEWAAEVGYWDRPKTPEGCLRPYEEEDAMALKKARKIVVGEKTYRWRVSANGRLHLAIQKDGESRREVIWLEEGIAVTPGFVRRTIQDKWR